MNTPLHRTFELDKLPEGTVLRSVDAVPGQVDARHGLRVGLTDAVAKNGVPGVDYVDQPTMVLLPVEFTTGRISVAIHSQLAEGAPDYARGFAGVAFHVTSGFEQFESVYLRPTNGTLVNPGAPRDQRGIQYFAYPDWPFDRLRSERPHAGYEGPVVIGPGRWHQLVLDVRPDRVVAAVDGTEVLCSTPLVAARGGHVGLFVDIGTDAHFANLVVSA